MHKRLFHRLANSTSTSPSTSTSGIRMVAIAYPMEAGASAAAKVPAGANSDTKASNTNVTLREGVAVRLELTGAPRVEHKHDGQLEVKQQPQAAEDDDVALIDCAAHAQANVTIRESSDCVYQQRHPLEFQQQQHPLQHQKASLLDVGGDVVGFRRAAGMPEKGDKHRGGCRQQGERNDESA